MNKNLKILVLSIITLLGSVAYANPFAYLKDYSFACYLDNRGDIPYYRGYVVFHNNQDDNTSVFTQCINLETNEGCAYSFVVGKIDDDKIGVVKMMGTEGLPPELLQNIPDFFNFHFMYTKHEEEISYNTVLEDQWPKYSQYYYFNKYLPMFHFSKITNSISPLKELSLDRAGMIQDFRPDDAEGNWLSASLAEFKALRPAQFNYEDKNTPMPKAKKMSVKLINKKINLDKNWVPYELPAEGLTGYKINLYSSRDAQIAVEDMSSFSEELKELYVMERQELFLNILLNSNKNIDYSTVTVSEKDNALCASCHFIDDNGIMNYQHIEISDYTIVNFSAFSEIYLNNQEYFEKIFNSIK